MNGPDRPPALELEGFEVPFGGTRGLEPLDLTVEAGETVVLVGASGAGKTSLLRAIAGLAPARSGTVRIGGRDVGHLPPEARGAVYLHQTPVLFPHLSVAENVAFPLRVRGVPEREWEGRIREALSAVRISELAERAPSTLSGGQKGRVALARAMVATPDLLLLDEPLVALDPGLRVEARAAIAVAQRASAAGVIVVTHDLEDAGALADRVGVLLDRRLAQLAPPRELFARPASIGVARFLGWPNEVLGTVSADGRSVESALGRIVPGVRSGELNPGQRCLLSFPPQAAALDGPAGGEALDCELEGVVHGPRGATAFIRTRELRLEAALGSPGSHGVQGLAAGTRVGLHLDTSRVVSFPA